MKQISILIIDDSTFLNNALKDSFEKRGYLVSQAFNISMATKILDERSFDFSLLDLELPDGRGEDLLPYLQSHEELRVIVLTTSRDKERRKKIFEFGNVVDYITKERYFADMELAIVRLIDIITTNEGLHILLVDDSFLFRTKLRILLSKRNFIVHDAINGKEAVLVMKENKIDGAIVDLEMPVMDGNKFMGVMKRDKKNLLVPVMVVSGSSDPDKIAKVLKNGASDFIKKPFSEEEFLLKVDKMMQEFKQQKQILLQKENLKYLNEELKTTNERALQANIELEIANKKAQEVNKAKSDFLSMMSHEIRTPLNAILGFIDILKTMEDDKEKYNYLDIIDKSSKTLTNTINDVLDISKIESGSFLIELIDFQAREEFNSVLALFKKNAEEKGIVLINSISSDIPEYLNSDILRIKQVISNLLSNAIKFTSKNKSVELIVSYDKKTELLTCQVKDEGIGIAKRNIPKIMEAFTQADISTTREYGGTGLGLSISSKFVELLGGELKVKSELGIGSEFYFEIPSNIALEVMEAKDSTHTNNFEGRKLLLVEDNEANQMFMKVLFKKMKIEYDIANNGLEAIEAFKDNKYDLILMDENMPNMSGIEATKNILKIEKEQRLTSTPIIALTANVLPGDKEKFLSAGMDEYLTKPISKSKLVDMLNQFLTV